MYEYSFLTEVSSIIFYWFWNIWLVQLIGYKGGINVIQPGGGVYLAGKVIDLLQDLGLPPPQSRDRLIFPLQMENKLPFLNIWKEEKMTGRARGGEEGKVERSVEHRLWKTWVVVTQLLVELDFVPKTDLSAGQSQEES